MISFFNLAENGFFSNSIHPEHSLLLSSFYSLATSRFPRFILPSKPLKKISGLQETAARENKIKQSEGPHIEVIQGYPIE